MEKKTKFLLLVSVFAFILGMLWGLTFSLSPFVWLQSISLVVCLLLLAVLFFVFEELVDISMILDWPGILFLGGIMLIGMVLVSHLWIWLLAGISLVAISVYADFS